MSKRLRICHSMLDLDLQFCMGCLSSFQQSNFVKDEAIKNILEGVFWWLVQWMAKGSDLRHLDRVGGRE